VVDTMQGADWGWLALAIVVAFAANVAYAVALQGTVRTRLPLGPTTELQVAMSFSNLAVPAIGGQGMQVRFLQKLGVDLPSAVAAGGVLSGFGALVAAFGCFAVALVVEPARVDLSLIPTNGLLLLLLAVAALVVVVSALLAALPSLRARVVPPLSRAMHTMADSLRSPGLVALLVGGNVVATTKINGIEKFRAVAEQMAARLPNAQHVTIPNTGHAPQLEDPEGVARAIYHSGSPSSSASA